jgi:hypothetical protein
LLPVDSEYYRLANDIHKTPNFRLLLPIYNNAGTKSKDLPTHPICSNQNYQAETIKVFTLMISDIACQKVKISSTLKTCDMSDISEKSIWFVVND